MADWQQAFFKSSYQALIAERKSAPSGRGSAASSDHRAVLPSADLQPEKYLYHAPRAREILIYRGVSHYLQLLTDRESSMDPLIIAPIVEELAFLSANEDFYAWSAAQSLAQITPYLSDSRGPWDQTQALARQRQVFILNALSQDFWPLLQRYSINLPTIQPVASWEEVDTLTARITEIYKQFFPAGRRGVAPEGRSLAVVFIYSGWQAVLAPGLDKLGTLNNPAAGALFPVEQFSALINYAYYQQPAEHWRELEEAFLAELQAIFKKLIINLARLGRH